MRCLGEEDSRKVALLGRCTPESGWCGKTPEEMWQSSACSV
uniref:Uncharacterized protein n=1 Tax=Aegilops tauschii subsp. strangulata TaxID=200361 RepID=A0A452XEM1_AEGTS